MVYTSYEQIEKECSPLYEEGKYREALDIIEKAIKELPKEEYDKYFYRIMNDKALFLVRMGDKESFYNIVKDLVEDGYPCGAWMFRRMPAEEDKRYAELKEKNDILKASFQKRSKIKYSVYLPDDYSSEKRYPVFLALHGDGPDGNIGDFSLGWKPDAAVNNGFIFVYVQSSQVYCHNGYAWCPNIEIARKDINECYGEICKEYSVDRDKLIIGGFSGGAMAVTDFAMMDTLPIRGFIALCPGPIQESFTIENSRMAKDRGVRAVIIEGAKDTQPNVQDLLKVFRDIEFPHTYTAIEGLGHWYPQDLNERLDSAIKFILD